MKHKLIQIVTFLSITLSQTEQIDISSEQVADYKLSSERYITNENGRIFMKVNIWGQVLSPGSHVVYEGIDFASLLSLVGGPQEGANLKKVVVYREKPDKNGKLVYSINIDDFIKTGSRSNFIKIEPNDTIIVPQKAFYLLIDRINTVNLLFSALTLYLQISTLI